MRKTNKSIAILLLAATLASLASFGGTYSMDGIFAGQFRNLIRLDNENAASNYAKFEPVCKEGLVGILAKYDELTK